MQSVYFYIYEGHTVMLDFTKFTKYSKPGPRYTSYPTALEFSDEFAYETYLKKLQAQDASRPLSLYFHLPFCRNACYFCGCNVVFTSKEEKMLRYVDYLKREMEILTRHLDTSREVIQLHFGGGTPTFFTAAQLKEVIEMIRSYFKNFATDAEISCEIDPRHIDEDQMKVLSEGGFNRVSFGIQDFDEKVQVAVHRVQPYDVTKAAMELARKYNMHSVNVDLIYGLPYQSLETFKKTLELALTLDPDRFAVFKSLHLNPHRIDTLVAHEHDVRPVERGFLFDNAPLPRLTAGLGVALNEIHVLYNNSILVSKDFQDLTHLALFFTRHDLDFIVLLNAAFHG